MNIESDALKVNIDRYRVEVTIDEKYAPLQAVMSQYYGVMEGFNTFLTELSHPYRNWPFIIKELRGYSLDYFHLFLNHHQGVEAAGLLVDIFTEAIESVEQDGPKCECVDNFTLFLQKVIKDSKDRLSDFQPVMDAAFNRISAISDDDFFLFVKSYYQIKRLAESLLSAAKNKEINYKSIIRLTIRYYQKTFTYWLSEDDPRAWFEKKVNGMPPAAQAHEWFNEITTVRIAQLDDDLKRLIKEPNPNDRDHLEALVTLPGYAQIVDAYRRVPNILLDAGNESGVGQHWKVLFLFHIMHLSGLSTIHEEVLREINRTLSWLIEHESTHDVRILLENTFAILKTRNHQYPVTSLSCILNMGQGVYKTDERDLVNFFIDHIIALGFEGPKLSGYGAEGQTKVNATHVQNIRTWLTIIELNPKWSARLLSGLIIHLSLSGTFIKDTDLFFRDVTALLNSDIASVFNLVKQLVRLFPVFFHDIGAEGELRDVSTQLDEMTHRKDVLIHFLRKQSHVESSNRTLTLIKQVIHFWMTKDKAFLEEVVSPELLALIKFEGPYIDGVHQGMRALLKKGLQLPEALLEVDLSQLEKWVSETPDIQGSDVERVRLMASFYQLLDQKYNLGSVRVDRRVEHLKTEGFPGLDQIDPVLAETDEIKKLKGLLDTLESLRQLILSSEQYEIKEDIYKKRHFTVDIPSMYGRYHELKFDAMGLMLRIEAMVNVLFESLIDAIDLSMITKATFYRIYDLLALFNRALAIEGIPKKEFERQLSFLSHSLEVRGFTFTQYLDIFKGFRLAVKNIFNDCFYNIHDQNLEKIFDILSPADLLAKFRFSSDETSGPETKRHQIYESFFRDRLATSLGLQPLDNFLTRILRTLFHQFKELPKNRVHQLLLYDHQQAITAVEPGGTYHQSPIHLGAKGYSLIKLQEFGMQVPPGFIITTEVFRGREIIQSYQPAKRNFAEQVIEHIRHVEEKTQRRFGDPAQPLLFSVRSGAAISQPGMMNTFLNVGMDEEIAEGLADLTNNPWFAWDNYRRFLQCYGMALGMERDHFDAIIRSYKSQIDVPLKRFLTGTQMKQLALKYKASIAAAGFGLDAIEDPMDQLFMAIQYVLDSWHSRRAKAYREIMGVSEDWGTAVTVQSMVYGNRSRQSGSGVVFTHNPRWSGDTLRLWGDFTIGNQGEDVVSGLVRTLPISITQQDVEMRDSDIILETHFPAIYAELKKWAVELTEKRGWSPQELEFTFQGPSADQLFLLQTRDMAIRTRKRVLAFAVDDAHKKRFIGNGIGVSGGAMSGRIVFDLQEVESWREREPDTDLILLRYDTVPDDIREINAADGLLTARGGLTSHAAVVAHRLDKTCVVGCDSLVCDEDQKICQFGNTRLDSGDFISIDGREGTVYKGQIQIKEEPNPEMFINAQAHPEYHQFDSRQNIHKDIIKDIKEDH